MQSSNRSGLQCYQHPNQQITNYCLHFDCLRPLCPDCVQIHTKHHQKQQIQSWKHCINKCSRSVKTTLDSLKSIYDQHNKYRGFKSVDSIETQNIKKLNHIKEKIYKVIDQAFQSYQQQLRALIRSQYKMDPPDTTKLKMAIEQLQKILMKLGHATTVLPALKKSLLLDHSSLLSYFQNMKQPEKKAPLSDMFIHQNFDFYPKLRGYIENSFNFQNLTNPQRFENSGNYLSPKVEHHQQAKSSRDSSSPFAPLSLNRPDYFSSESQYKFLHFFIPNSKELKILHIDDALEKKKWKSVIFKAKDQLPCYFNSIITPKGQIYLTGGSQQEKKCRQIYRYDHQKNTLDFVCKMNVQRSSHAICFLNNCIYLIGGFTKNGQTSRSCQVFQIDNQKCDSIAPLNTPSANSSAAAFNNQYIFKFGGVQNKVEGNNLIEMYSLTANRWIVVDIQTPRTIPKLPLLSFSAAVQINEKQIFVFGGYNDSQMQKPQRLSYVLQINANRASVTVKNYNTNPLSYAQGFWNNNPIIYKNKVFALQNITDQQDQLTAIADQRRVVVFNGQRWL